MEIKLYELQRRNKELIDRIIKEELEKQKEKSAPNIDLEIGDTILTGKFKNKKVEVKEFGTDKNGQPTVNGKPMLAFRIEKLMPEKKK